MIVSVVDNRKWSMCLGSSSLQNEIDVVHPTSILKLTLSHNILPHRMNE